MDQQVSPLPTGDGANTLSVIIPAFNAAMTIETAIRSAWSSGASQVVVVDDGSSDATASIANGLGANVRIQDNIGAAAARRAGLEIASHPFVVFLDADDSLIPEGIARSLTMAAEAGSPAIVAGAFVGVDHDGSAVGFKPWDRRITAWELIKRQHAPAPPGTFLWPRAVLESALFSVRPVALWPRYAEDFEMLLRGALFSPVVQHHLPVMRYALSGGKSAALPTNSVQAGSEIAAHYAGLLGVPFRQPTKRQLEGRAIVRAAMSQKAGGRRVSWFAQLVRAFSRDPAFVSRTVARRVRRKVNRSVPGADAGS